jgi:hypothetical protein
MLNDLSPETHTKKKKKKKVMGGNFSCRLTMNCNHLNICLVCPTDNIFTSISFMCFGLY